MVVVVMVVLGKGKCFGESGGWTGLYEMCERCGEELRELHLMVQGFVWDFGPETCLLGTSPGNLL